MNIVQQPTFSSQAQIVYVMGFAGSGKTTFVNSFSDFLRKRGYRVATVNLDPGVEVLPYKPNYDVRSIVRLSNIMREEGLGQMAVLSGPQKCS